MDITEASLQGTGWGKVCGMGQEGKEGRVREALSAKKGTDCRKFVKGRKCPLRNIRRME